ncbi:hypothetical protein HK405_009349, partial [Cladochytrium tenue]
AVVATHGTAAARSQAYANARNWSATEVLAWLIDIGCSETIIDMFRGKNITGVDLLSMDPDGMLKKLGMTSVDMRISLMNAIDELKSGIGEKPAMADAKKDDGKAQTPAKGKKDKDGDGGGGEDAGQVHHVDTRLTWFEERVLNALKLKNDKWKKMVTIQENLEIMSSFLDKEFGALLFYLSPKDELLPAVVFPPFLKKKSVYFLKNTPGQPVQSPELDRELTIGDLTANPLEFLSTLLEEVYLPLLTNPRNLESWPEVVANDVLRYFHQLNGAVYVIAGKSKGKTMLPLPHGAKVTGVETADRSVLHSLESAVIDWSHQIKEVIKSSSAAPLDEGQHPGPSVEIDFWAARAANLKSIHQQLTDDKIQKIAHILEASRSTYYPAFKAIFNDVVFALDEASDINRYLKTLRPSVERLTGTSDFAELVQIFPAMIRALSLIWRHSRFYNTPARLTVVLREVCNDVIEQARSFIQPSELFGSEPEEAAERLRLAVRVCDALRQDFLDERAALADSQRPWAFDVGIVFARLDQFAERVRCILELFDSIIEFNRLEKIEIGGTKGKILSSQIAQIFTEFQAALAAFSKIKYDILDISLPDFKEDLGKFHTTITDLDRRIGTILCQGFDDCSSISGCFRLIDSFAGLLNRPTIQHDFEKKYYELLRAFSRELDDVAAIFAKFKDAPPIHYNMAPVTGAVAWTHELKDRIGKGMEKLKTLTHASMNSDHASMLKEKYTELYSQLDSYESTVFTRWADGIIDESEANLHKPLLVRRNHLLYVNFDPKVVALLREVKYFEALGVKAPEAALSIYSKAEVFRKYVFSLDHISSTYNGIRTGLIDVERPLFERKIREIDLQLDEALTSLNWKSESVEQYITTISAVVGELNSIMQLTKNNV